MSRHAHWFTQLEEPRQMAAASPAPLDTPGRLLALDLGAKRIGVAVSDELRITARPLPMISRPSWKELLRQVAGLVQSFQAHGLVSGLPLRLDGGGGGAAEGAGAGAGKFWGPLTGPVSLTYQRLSTLPS